MTPEDIEASKGIQQAKDIAEEMGIALATRTDNAKVGIYAAAIMYAGLCVSSGVGLHAAINLLMSIYKEMDQVDQTERGPLQ